MASSMEVGTDPPPPRPPPPSSLRPYSPSKRRKVLRYSDEAGPRAGAEAGLLEGALLSPGGGGASAVARAHGAAVLHQVTRLSLAHGVEREAAETSAAASGGGARGRSSWHMEGTSTLYLINNGSNGSSNADAEGAAAADALALHLRSSCRVAAVKLEAVASNKLQALREVEHLHADPLRKVLLRPASTVSYAKEEEEGAAAAPAAPLASLSEGIPKKKPRRLQRLDADAQSCRGAAGMTTALRAASAASNLGELRVAYRRAAAAAPSPAPAPAAPSTPAKADIAGAAAAAAEAPPASPAAQRLAEAVWRHDLGSHVPGGASEAKGDGRGGGDGAGAGDRRERASRRVESVARQLARAGPRAVKLTVTYRVEVPASGDVDLGGLHVRCGPRPVVYSTPGTAGDHEGPRTWVPVLDSLATHHRATHQISVRVTAPMTDGITALASGDDAGASTSYLHLPVETPGAGAGPPIVSSAPDADAASKRLEAALGRDHVEFLRRVRSGPTQLAGPPPPAPPAGAGGTDAHVIPNEPDDGGGGGGGGGDGISLDSIHATVVYENAAWSPIPARSLGFCAGPLAEVEDAECFADPRSGSGGSSTDEDGDEAGAATPNASSDRGRGKPRRAGRHRGRHGIRQYFVRPAYERKLVHLRADRSLLPDRLDLRPRPLTSRQRELSRRLRGCVQASTVGVPLRALRLMRDVLALPTFRTWSHAQVWIPDCVAGGSTSGALHSCPEVSSNGFLGWSLLDSRLLPPPGSRLPYHQGGRALQFAQARAAVRGWITAALPLGGQDDVGNGYIHAVAESFVMSLYERAHGAHGEGGAKGGVFYSKRYSATAGLNSPNLDFLPVPNIEDVDAVAGGFGSEPTEERSNEHLWRSASNGTESHTSAVDEFNIRQLLSRDAVEALERVSEKDKNVPSPSLGWFGSHLSLTFLSSNATSSSDLGCGAVELVHPVGGLVYRALKSDVFRSIVEGRAGVANFLRLLRAAFLAAHLGDVGENELRLPARREKKPELSAAKSQTDPYDALGLKPPFVVCVNEILKKKGLTHTLFTRALQNLSGPLREALLIGTLVDVEPNELDPRTRRSLVEPEGFPNSYVRGSSLLYCRVGVQVEFGDGGGSAQAQSAIAKGVSMQAYAEPIIPEGGIAFGGPITMRVVENEGQFREYVKELIADGSRRDWGSTFLHAKPVSTLKAQTAASGTIENTKETGKFRDQEEVVLFPSLQSKCGSRAFTDTNFHRAGYQAIELIRLTNLTPLLWVRVDPLGMYSGRISVFQPDSCLAECLFHDGDAGAQVEALRSLAERPLRIQASTKVTTIYDVEVSELPVRVLADCLRGSPALHSSLPHTPAVRCQAALAISQWQNNKAPSTKDTVGLDKWVGAGLLIQYFRERFFSNGVVMPVKFSRLALKRSETEAAAEAATTSETGAANPRHDHAYEYLDSLEEGEERAERAAAAVSIEMEEDEEYRVRAAVVNAISSIRAKDGQTPAFVLQFLETVLEADDAELVSHLVYPDEELMLEKKYQHMKSRAEGVDSDSDDEDEDEGGDELTPSLSFVSGKLVADALLSLCNINAWPTMIMDPATGRLMQPSGRHPVSRLIKIVRNWLDWELYREKIRLELESETESGVSGNCHNVTAASALFALSNLSILKQSTSDAPAEGRREDDKELPGTCVKSEEIATAQFYVSIFDSEPTLNDITRAASAQAMACICCAADRFEQASKAVGLLTAMEFLLDRIIDPRTSPGLRQTLALIMMDACTGKVCSMQRVGVIAGQNDLVSSLARFLTGPLGACHGGDNGSAILTTVSAAVFPAANAVNEGARRGRRLVGRAGHPKESVDRSTIVRVARFATRLWRTINGDPPEPSNFDGESENGVCAFDGALRCSLLALWQLIWPRGCFSVLQVQDWKSEEHTKAYTDLGAHLVMQISDDEKDAAAAEESSLADINRLVEMELERQSWRGDMAKKAYDMYKASKGSTAVQDVAAAEQGIGQPLPPIQRDAAFKQGGWIASAAQQRRALALDGGIAVTKLRLNLSSKS